MTRLKSIKAIFSVVVIIMLLFSCSSLILGQFSTGCLFGWLGILMVLGWSFFGKSLEKSFIASGEDAPTSFDELLWVGIGISLCSLALYIKYEFSALFLSLWLGGLCCIGLFYWSNRKSQNWAALFARLDYKILACLLLAFSVVYLAYPDAYPYQMNSDEVIIRDQIRIMCLRQTWNPLGPSGYFAFPVLIHLVFGHLALLMGGITFLHLRTIHATFGLLCVLFSYVFYRSLNMARAPAVVATIIVGINHSFLTISRMVSRNNTAMLLEIIALSLLFQGMIKKCPYLMFIGGIAAGTTFYTYPPARVTFFIFGLAYLISMWRKVAWKEFLSCLFPAALSFAITIFPMIWSSHTAPKGTFDYADNQWLITKGGRAVEKLQVFAKTEEQGVLTNIRQGLLAFNYPYHDNSNIYINDGFAFVDPCTGILIWIGIICIIRTRRVRSASKDADILCVSSFVSLWLILSFLITFAPSYTRLFVILPFIGYLAATGIFWIAGSASSALLSSRSEFSPNSNYKLKSAAVAALAATVVVLNVQILWVFASIAQIYGDVEGTTFRIVQRFADQSDRSFYLAANERYPYYWQMQPDWEWIGWADGDDVGDRMSVIAPDRLSPDNLHAPFVLFLNEELWTKVKKNFQRKYNNYAVLKVVSNGHLLAVLVPPDPRVVNR